MKQYEELEKVSTRTQSKDKNKCKAATQNQAMSVTIVSFREDFKHRNNEGSIC